MFVMYTRLFPTRRAVSSCVSSKRSIRFRYASASSTAPVLKSLAWCVGILVTLAPLAVSRTKRTGIR